MSRSISQIVDEYNELIIKSGSNATIKKFRDKEYALIRLEALKTRLGIDYEPEDVGKVDVPEPQETSAEKVVEISEPELKSSDTPCLIPKELQKYSTGTIVKHLILFEWDDEEILSAVIGYKEKNNSKRYCINSIKYWKERLNK